MFLKAHAAHRFQVPSSRSPQRTSDALGDIVSVVIAAVTTARSQSHGLVIENYLAQKFYAPFPEQAATATWDVPAGTPATADLPEALHGLPVSIKSLAEKRNTISLSSALRQSSITEDFLLMLARHKQATPNTKAVVGFTAYSISAADWAALRGELDLAMVEELVALVTNTNETPTARRAQSKAWKRANAAKLATSKIVLNSKIGAVDGQARVQCSINVKHLEQFIVANESTPSGSGTLHGVAGNLIIANSPARQIRKRRRPVAA